MKIQIKKGLIGAQEARGIGILIDVFRASNTIISCLTNGAESVIPVDHPQKALDLKKEHPDCLIFGEDKGVKLEGFDHNNSPAKAAKLNLKGKTLALCTSGGTKGIVKAKQVDELWIGSFANVDMIIRMLRKKNPPLVTLIAIGKEGKEEAVEDELCALYLDCALKRKQLDYMNLKEKILEGSGAERLRRLKQGEDLEFCLKLNHLITLPILSKNENKITLLK